MSQRKSIEDLKFKGTYRKDRHGEREKVEKELIAISNSDSIPVVVPECLNDKKIVDVYISHINYLKRLRMLEEHDLILLQSGYEYLQRALSLRNKLDVIEAKDSLLGTEENFKRYESTLNLYRRLLTEYQNIVKKYLTTPAERLKVVLDVQQVEKNEVEVKSKIKQLMEKKNA